MKLLSILLIGAITFSPIYAKNSKKIAKNSYHQICKDLSDNIVKPEQNLTKSEKKIVKKYLKAKGTKKLNLKALNDFENAIKKHQFITVVGSNEKNLSQFPKKSKIGDWYKLDSDMNISKIMDSSRKGTASMGDRNGVK